MWLSYCRDICHRKIESKNILQFDAKAQQEKQEAAQRQREAQLVKEVEEYERSLREDDAMKKKQLEPKSQMM